MKRMVRYALCGAVMIVALMLAGCEVMEPAGDIAPPMQVKPTVPLKKRPIVPTTKLPRPRVAGEEYAAMEAEAYEATEWEYAEYSEEW